MVEDHQPERSDGVVHILMAGFIFASKPVLVGDTAQTAGDETYPVSREIVRDTRDVFALRLRGDSMIDALVNDGDVVVLRKVDQGKNGDMVAVWL